MISLSVHLTWLVLSIFSFSLPFGSYGLYFTHIVSLGKECAVTLNQVFRSKVRVIAKLQYVWNSWLMDHYYSILLLVQSGSYPPLWNALDKNMLWPKTKRLSQRSKSYQTSLKILVWTNCSFPLCLFNCAYIWVKGLQWLWTCLCKGHSRSPISTKISLPLALSCSD